MRPIAAPQSSLSDAEHENGRRTPSAASEPALGSTASPSSTTTERYGTPTPTPAFGRRRRTCASSLAAIVAYLCWNLRFMSSSLRMLALFPSDEGGATIRSDQPQFLRAARGSSKNATRTSSARTWSFSAERSHSVSSPSICLLMSFPNSGTSYTLKNAQLLSGKIVGTNYEAESKARRPLFEQAPDVEEEGSLTAVLGPFIVNASFARTDVVLTKTHCNMKPDFASFERSCRSVRKVVNRTSVEAGAYSIDRVTGAVHLIRNPLDNVVARMHHGINKYRGVLPNATLDTFTNDRDGFHNWCRFLDSTFGRIRILLPNATQSILPSIPCHSDFLHYIGWHNFALDFVRVHHLPYHVLHYEDYGSDFHATASQLLDFLGLEAAGEPAPFVAGKSYLDFYDDSEMVAIYELLSRTCSPPLWKLVQWYLPPDYSRSNGTRGRENDPPFGAPSFFATTTASL
jgi:Sulfotransferase domain